MRKYLETLQRLRHFLLAPRRLPGWLLILLAVATQIPDWKARWDFWVGFYSANSGALRMLAPFLSSPYFGLALLLGGLVYLYFVRGVIHIHHHSATATVQGAAAVAAVGSVSIKASAGKPIALTQHEESQDAPPNIDWKLPAEATEAFGASALLRDRAFLIEQCDKAQCLGVECEERIRELNKSRRDFNSVQRAQPAIDKYREQMGQARSVFDAAGARLREIKIALEGQIVGELAVGTLVAKGFPIQTDKWREAPIEKSLWRDLTIDFLKMTANRKLDGSVMFTSIVIGRAPEKVEIPNTKTTPETQSEHALAKYRREHDLPHLTLYDLFITDFRLVQKVCNRSTLVNEESKASVLVWICAVIDLERANKVIQIYIPYFLDTYGACSKIIELIPATLEFSSAVKIEGKPTGGTRIESSDAAVFSGIVFVYHETELDAEQIGELTRAFRESGYSVTFRGSSYLSVRKMQIAAGHI